MRGLETDHVISGPMRGLKKCIGNGHQTDRQTDRHVDSMTDPAQRAELSLTIQTNPWTLTLQVKCTIFCLNRGLRVNLELYAQDFPEVTLNTFLASVLFFSTKHPILEQ